MTIARRGGLLGLSDWICSSAKAVSSSLVKSITNHDAWAIRLVFAAGVATILHKAGVPVPHYAAAFAVALGLAALLYEMNAATYALRSFWNGKMVGTIGWSFVWLVAFAYSMNQWVGAAGENEGAKSNLHKAAFVQSQDVRAELQSAKADLDRIDERLRMVPQRTADQAQAAIENAMSHKYWKSTDGCKETKGPQTRAFCDDYRAAEADKAGATAALTLREERKVALKRYDDARAVAANTKTETTEGRQDLVILTKYAGMSEDDARTLNALGSIIAVSIFLSVATMLRELEHLRSTSQRTPMFGWLRRWWTALLTGKSGLEIAKDDADRGALVVHTEIRESNDAKRALGEIAKLIESRHGATA